MFNVTFAANSQSLSVDFESQDKALTTDFEAMRETLVRLPPGGENGDLLGRYGVDALQWITPAEHSEEDNTRPITAGAVYLEIGNINALLHTI